MYSEMIIIVVNRLQSLHYTKFNENIPKKIAYIKARNVLNFDDIFLY